MMYARTYVRTYVRMHVSVTLRNVAVTSCRNVANQRSNVIITRKRYSVGLADSAARGIVAR